MEKNWECQIKKKDNRKKRKTPDFFRCLYPRSAQCQHRRGEANTILGLWGGNDLESHGATFEGSLWGPTERRNARCKIVKEKTTIAADTAQRRRKGRGALHIRKTGKTETRNKSWHLGWGKKMFIKWVRPNKKTNWPKKFCTCGFCVKEGIYWNTEGINNYNDICIIVI